MAEHELPPIVDKVPERATPNKAIVLGRKYRDVTTRLEGRAIMYSMHLNGCNQVVLDPGVKKDGELAKVVSVDEGLLVAVDTNEPVPDMAGKGNFTGVVEARY